MLTYMYVSFSIFNTLNTLSFSLTHLALLFAYPRVFHFASTSIRYIPLNRAGTHSAILSP